jgi:hypothetical protein
MNTSLVAFQHSLTAICLIRFIWCTPRTRGSVRAAPTHSHIGRAQFVAWPWVVIYFSYQAAYHKSIRVAALPIVSCH